MENSKKNFTKSRFFTRNLDLVKVSLLTKNFTKSGLYCTKSALAVGIGQPISADFVVSNSDFENFEKSSNQVQICKTNSLFKQTGTNYQKLVQSATNWFKLVQTGSNKYKLVQTSTIWFKLVQTGSN